MASVKVGFKSRKFVQAIIAEVALIAAMFVSLLRDTESSIVIAIVGGIVGVAVGYGFANAWQSRTNGNGTASDNTYDGP